jgi:hypothetical protein
MVLDGPISGVWFEANVAEVLAPELRPGDVVIIDNLFEPQAQRDPRTDPNGFTKTSLENGHSGISFAGKPRLRLVSEPRDA